MNWKRTAVAGLLTVSLTLSVVVLPRAFGQGSKQSGNTPTARRVAMHIGVVEVWLGMPRELAEEEFTKVGYSLTSGDDPIVSERTGKTDVKIFGQLTFRNGRLFHASRSWPSGEHSFESVFAVLTNFTQDGSTVCGLSAQPYMEPGFQMQRIWIDCGDRTLFLFEETGPSKSSGVDESIGGRSEKQQGKKP